MRRRALVVLAAALVTAACTTGPNNGRSAATPDPEPFLHAPTVYRATAPLVDAQGRALGTVAFTEERQMVRVDVKVTGLAAGEKGLHVHSAGKCEPPAFESAGGHFNPGNKKHGARSQDGPHAGDLGNVRVGDDGRGEAVFYTSHLSTNPANWNSVLLGGGLSVVLHAQPDDERTDPSGNSGARIACGVVKRLPLPL